MLTLQTIEFLILQRTVFDFYFTSDLFQLIRYDKQSEYIIDIEEDNFLVQLTDSDGNTIFHRAAIFGRLQVTEAINNIDAHMNDRGTGKYNVTPLISAS